jgi:hypothetical protein
MLDAEKLLCDNALVISTVPRPQRTQDMHAPGDSIPFALSEVDQRLYEPRAVPLGKECGCICPGCKQPVYAKHCMSGKRAPHFAHAPGSDCVTGYETALHLAAKQLIEARAVLAFPELVASLKIVDDTGQVHEPERQLVTAGRRPLKSVVLEERLGQIRPDIRVDAEGLGAVLVEVAVTHFVDERKLQQIAQEGIPAIEIDLSKFRDATFASLEKALFDDPRCTKWLHHSDVANAKRDLQESIQWLLDAATKNAEAWARTHAAREKAERAEQAALHAYQTARLLAEVEAADARREQVAERKRVADESLRRRRREEIRRAAAFKARPEEQKRHILLRRLGLDRLPSILALNVRGATAFGVKDPLVWQATLFGGLVHQQPAKGNGWVVRNYARAWMRHRFSVPPERDMEANDAIDDYLMKLAAAGALIDCRTNSYVIAVADLTCFENLTAVRNDRNFEPARLQWTPKDQWPDQAQVWVLTETMKRNVHEAGRWFKMASEMHRNTGFSPIQVCEWASQIGATKEAIAHYLIRTGYLRVAPKVSA